MKITSIEFNNKWSWCLIFDAISKMSDNKIERIFMNQNPKIKTAGADVVLAQNVTLLKKFKERLKVICRLGGNMNFDGMKNISGLLREMSKCYCIIATNKNLYDIAKPVNKKCYLIPNGLNIDEWCPPRGRPERPFTAGFCGNISNRQYRHYKGWEGAKKACDNLGIELKTALFKDQQIPHDRMKEDFYYQIDVLIHPTLGEGCSNTLMEAAACGVPIITTREAGFHGEILEHGKNVLFCKRKTSSIKMCLCALLRDMKLRKDLSKNIRKFAVKYHDINLIVKEYDKIFKECHEANKKRG